MVAVDLFNCNDRIEAVKHYTGTQFEYFPGLTHEQTAPYLEERDFANFDIVVLSGVLYHCYGRWMRDAGSIVEYMARFNWRQIDRTGSNPPHYKASESAILDESTGTCIATRTILESPPVDLPERIAKIALDDLN